MRKPSVLLFSVCLSLGSSAFAARFLDDHKPRSNDQVVQRCKEILTGAKAQTWSAEEAAWMQLIQPVKLKFASTEPKLSPLQKVALGIPADMEIQTSSLEVRLGGRREKLLLETRSGRTTVARLELDWDSSKLGIIDQVRPEVKKLLSDRSLLEDVMRAEVHFMPLRQVGGITLGYALKTKKDLYSEDYPDLEDAGHFWVDLFIVRPCRRIEAEPGDFMFPMEGTEARAKNLCLTPLGSLFTPATDEDYAHRVEDWMAGL